MTLRAHVPALVASLAATASAVACAPRLPMDWRGTDVLTEAPPRPPRAIGGVTLSDADYEQFVNWGEEWFRYGVFGTERAITDVAGVMMGTVEVPCGGDALPDCYTEEPVLRYYAKALDKLDGVEGNLFTGNGGKDGPGFTNDLVIEFPPGARLYGGVPVPEQVHTGLDVDAGDAWPIGVGAVPVTGPDADLAWLPQPSALGVGPAPEGRVRFRLSCAMCHYSLDVDADGEEDIHSTKIGEPTPGSPYSPQDGWGVGNQDMAIGWIVALSANPLLLAPVFSGPIGPKEPEAPIEWMRWVRDNYVGSREAVLRDVVVGMIQQPRGYADVTPNARFDTQQIPSLYTWHNWASNSDGAVPDATDRNNIVWAGTLDFTGLIGTCAERAGSVKLPWDEPTVLQELPCATLVDMMTRYSPAGIGNPAGLPALKADILGESDGVPGIIPPDEVFVMFGSPTLPKEIYEHPANVAGNRQREFADFGGDAKWRSSEMALLGIRLRTPDHLRKELDLDAVAKRYPALNMDDFVNQCVNLMLDWMEPPPNVSPLLAASKALVPTGHAVFREAGCEQCHRGPFGTDNVIHPVSSDPTVQFGLPRATTTAGWRVLDRASGPAIGTNPERTLDGRNLRRLVSPPYDPATGLPYRAGGPLPGLLSVQLNGYKSTTLRNLWVTAPYLHEGSVGVGLEPGTDPGTDLRALLARAGSPEVIYGMGEMLGRRERDHANVARPNAALSLQALVLKSERERVVAANHRPTMSVTRGGTWRESPNDPARELMSMDELGSYATGHDFYLDDQPGGEKVTALVAWLLAQDDCPRALPGDDASKACSW